MMPMPDRPARRLPLRARCGAPLRVLAAGVALGLPLLLATPANASAQEALDQVFAAWNTSASPGCAVGVDQYRASSRAAGGASQAFDPLVRAWGMAELEHGIANSPATIFEAGSVSKQFTAAAVILLDLEGVLSVDDDVRRWIPELPDYGALHEGRGITLRHMLNHTSGLRDWGAVAAIGGWARGERSHTHDHVLEIAARQEALNYPPGEAYSYSNTGYNLLALVVERATGESFADFSRERLFEPLGLADTQWRDDYRRIVPGRSGAYQWSGGGWVIDRPIEHVHGNGGLLTTVGDLLRWNRVLAAAGAAAGSGAGAGTGVGVDGVGAEFMALADALGGAAFFRRMVDQGVLTDGSTITYASGVVVETFDGRPIISHTGATSGYRAYLALLPEDGVSVALLCNTGNANPGQLGGRVARLFLEPREAEVNPEAGSAAEAAASQAADPDDEPGGEASEWSAPGPEALALLAGRYESHEAETAWTLEVEGADLVLVRRPGSRSTLRPTGPDTFAGAGGEIRFHRDATGRVIELGISQARVWDLRFRRVEE
ncbi:MAG: class A beta-lactamase-related serine hydrolase [Gemmatimonadales bacterium]|nr:MAG: class A beta-lactamase-related serine hydrolase [Gemmatimonadales bacterium]